MIINDLTSDISITYGRTMNISRPEVSRDCPLHPPHMKVQCYPPVWATQIQYSAIKVYFTLVLSAVASNLYNDARHIRSYIWTRGDMVVEFWPEYPFRSEQTVFWMTYIVCHGLARRSTPCDGERKPWQIRRRVLRIHIWPGVRHRRF